MLAFQVLEDIVTVVAVREYGGRLCPLEMRTTGGKYCNDFLTTINSFVCMPQRRVSLQPRQESCQQSSSIY